MECLVKSEKQYEQERRGDAFKDAQKHVRVLGIFQSQITDIISKQTLNKQSTLNISNSMSLRIGNNRKDFELLDQKVHVDLQLFPLGTFPIRGLFYN